MNKKSARARRRGEGNPPGKLLSISGEDLEARREQRLKTLAILKTRRTPLAIIEIGAQADQTAADAVAAAVAREPPRLRAACVEGCAWCCHQRVGVAVPEVVRIAGYLGATLTPLEIDATLTRIESTLEKRRLAPSAHGVPCPLLVNNRCSAYPVRPLTCRGFNSSDPLPCQASVTEDRRTVIPVYAPQVRLMSLVLDGMRAGLTESGLKGDLLELAAALRIALTVPDAVTSWLQGKQVFGPARLS